MSLVLFLDVTHQKRNYTLSSALFLTQTGELSGCHQARDLAVRHQTTITEFKKGSQGPGDTFTVCASSALQLTYMENHQALSRTLKITVYYLFKSLIVLRQQLNSNDSDRANLSASY